MHPELECCGATVRGGTSKIPRKETLSLVVYGSPDVRQLIECFLVKTSAPPIISDEAAMPIGSMAMLGSAALGASNKGSFEPSGGSARTCRQGNRQSDRNDHVGGDDSLFA
jgi:hypothetical protein